MSISSSISRFSVYYERHGFWASIRRAGLTVRRALFSNRMVVFYCDLSVRSLPTAHLPSFLKVERKTNQSELSPQDLHEISNFWNPKLARRSIRERFQQGASLWLIRSGNQVAGYSWTIRGRTIAAYYFPLGPDDVQLFDFYVSPKFRGRAILWFLISHILYSLRDEGAARVFGDVAEWNQASLSFYRTIPFRRLGLVTSFTIVGHTFVCWRRNKTVRQTEPTGGNLPRPVINRGTSGERA